MADKALIAVAHGDRYARQTDRMVDSFIAHNPGWDVLRYYGGDLEALLPDACRGWTPFNKCEIGRWLAMGRALETHKTALYCDGDVRWYGKYQTGSHAMSLTPHYVTAAARRNAKHWIWKDGAANIGIVEMKRHGQTDGILDFVVGEVLHRPAAYMHGEQLWLQNIVSAVPECGFDCVFSRHAGLNVARWNLRKGDRVLERDGGKIKVSTPEGERFPLVAFHFSSKSLGSLDLCGDIASDLKRRYLEEARQWGL
jgi:hypothetical protein